MKTDPTAAPSIECRLCRGNAAAIFSQTVLKQFLVRYFRCGQCDLIQTEAPYWLAQAYSRAIAAQDVGAMSRVLSSVGLCSAVARSLGAQSGLDFGGGSGALTRLLRDRGYAFEWLDAHCENVYAQGFMGDLSRRYDLVTAFEVWEHFSEPGQELEALFSAGHGAILVGTLLHWGHQEGWWYYSPETGQHIAFYSTRTLEFIASRFGYDVLWGHGTSLFLRKDAPSLPGGRFVWQKLMQRPALLRRIGETLDRVAPRKGLAAADALKLCT